MDLAQLAGLALQHVGGQGAGANGGHGPGANGGHRPGVHGGHGPGRRLGQNRRLRMLALQRSLGMRKRHQSAKAEAFKAQARHANSTGRNRTNDFLMPSTIGQRQHAPLRVGKGKWKSWTPEAVLRAAFAKENVAQRDVADQVDGASHGHASACRLFASQLILNGQREGLEQFVTQALHDSHGELDFVVNNMIFDETELEINLHGYGIGAWSILASHAQRSFRVCGKTHDFDIIRLPVALPNKQATTMWGSLCTGEGGLWPGLSEIKAKKRAILVTCDAAPANLKLLGHLQVALDPKTLLLPLLCTQHRTGNVIERITKLLSLLPGTFAVSKTVRSGFVVRKLTEQVRSVLTQKLQVFDQVPPGLHQEWADAQLWARQILDLVKQGHDENSQTAKACDDFLNFFAGPWTGLVRGMGRVSAIGYFCCKTRCLVPPSG